MQINEFMHKHATLGILFVLSLGMWLGWFAVFQWQLCGQWCNSQPLVMKVQVFMVCDAGTVCLCFCRQRFIIEKPSHQCADGILLRGLV